jgi:hypothetical protein
MHSSTTAGLSSEIPERSGGLELEWIFTNWRILAQMGYSNCGFEV